MSINQEGSRLLAQLARRPIKKDWFHKNDLVLAKQLMWDGYLESTGIGGDFVTLTPAGKAYVEVLRADTINERGLE